MLILTTSLWLLTDRAASSCDFKSYIWSNIAKVQLRSIFLAEFLHGISRQYIRQSCTTNTFNNVFRYNSTSNSSLVFCIELKAGPVSKYEDSSSSGSEDEFLVESDSDDELNSSGMTSGNIIPHINVTASINITSWSAV